MRFALLGDHPDGLDMARALVASGRHGLATYTGDVAGADRLRRWGLGFQPVRDVEEVLADPSIEAVIVASPPSRRPAHLRRALQSERHVLCVHPADDSPDLAYEAAMIQADTRRVLLPLLPEALHPGLRRLAEFARAAAPRGGEVQLVELDRWATEVVLLGTDFPVQKAALPGWDVVRLLGGELAEISGLTTGEELDSDHPVLVTGRFQAGGLLRASFLQWQPQAWQRFAVLSSFGRAELLFPTGWPGPAVLREPDETGEVQETTWETWNPWPALVEVFEAALRGRTALTWQTAVRSLELDDAVRRSVARRRVSPLEYPEATEEVGFKGTMTLTGCGLLWAILFLFIVSIWVPRAAWAILPVLAIFLVLQVLRWLIPRTQKPPESPEG
jgi:predicted dehydrogenase